MERRKNPRLSGYDYSHAGAYFVTVCTHGKSKILSSVVGRGLAPAFLRLTDCGRIVEQQLLELEKRFNHIKIDKYVIMPNHVHVIFIVDSAAAGASPRPTRGEPKRKTIPQSPCGDSSLYTREPIRKELFKYYV